MLLKNHGFTLPTCTEILKVVNDQKAVVLPFKDLRENVNENKMGLYLIPILPGYGWVNYATPEGMQMHLNSGLWTNYKPTEDFPKALAGEIENTKIFKEIYFDFKKGDADISIEGKIISTYYKVTIISYGLSVYGPVLWFIGLPAGTISNDLSIELNCVDIKSNNVIFSKTYTATQYKKTSWIYALPNDFNYPSMLKDLYKDFIGDLKNQHFNTRDERALINK